VKVQPLRDPGTTGNFEVRLLGAEEELIHSKRSRGQGKCTDPKEEQAVLAAIGAFLQAKQAQVDPAASKKRKASDEAPAQAPQTSAPSAGEEAASDGGDDEE